MDDTSAKCQKRKSARPCYRRSKWAKVNTLRVLLAYEFSALPTSQIPWAKRDKTSKRAKWTALLKL